MSQAACSILALSCGFSAKHTAGRYFTHFIGEPTMTQRLNYFDAAPRGYIALGGVKTYVQGCGLPPGARGHEEASNGQ
ncbi:hypothetical protein AWM79_15795 [Pseudomonas agarici]|uniref:Uncharacterized protein n=1 Tax=Pseudomonas agarici TaxID=46677 RepID=A0A0X1T3K8_PSEAA|nr:hypothetical protein AWM79_15795 [Pseudomonas agarici]SEL62764.1 hypothetical protein SAMN05216604_1254 [Pseudomonas agarici]